MPPPAAAVVILASAADHIPEAERNRHDIVELVPRHTGPGAARHQYDAHAYQDNVLLRSFLLERPADVG